ncbi:MAG: hypothetical protein JSV16_12075 [Candidatus Hydrogenedentota bacterium]|nr:MAG: hypothetical protein JSV16_12075 [Candidatus Hydrogenedentota bacterium]
MFLRHRRRLIYSTRAIKGMNSCATGRKREFERIAQSIRREKRAAMSKRAKIRKTKMIVLSMGQFGTLFFWAFHGSSMSLFLNDFTDSKYMIGFVLSLAGLANCLLPVVVGTITSSIIISYFYNRTGGSTITAIVIHGLGNDTIGFSGKSAQEPIGIIPDSISIAMVGLIAAVLIIFFAGKNLGLREEKGGN